LLRPRAGVGGLIVGPVDASARSERHRAKFAKAKACVHANVSGALQKLAK
jgi:hypothetical protein